MADKTTTGLTAGTLPLDGTELHYVVQGGNSRKVAGAEIVKIAHNQPFSTITGTPTTLSGYGITDAASSAQGALADSALQPAAIGTSVQAQGATLDSLEGLSLVAGDVLYATAADTLAKLAKGADGEVLKLASGVPSWGTVAGTGDMVGPASSTASNFALFDGTTGKLLKDSGVNAADFATAAQGSTADSAMQFASSVLNEPDMASDSATKVPTQASVKAYADTKLGKASNLSDLASVPTAAGNLGIIRDAMKIYGASGDGTTANDTAFAAADAAGGLVFLPKPATKYALTAAFATTKAAWLPDPTIPWAALTDSGKFDMHRGHFTGAGNGANVWRFSDRVFIGEAASKWAGSAAGASDTGTSWFGSDTTGPAYLAVGASLVVIAPETADSGMKNGGLFATRSSDLSGPGIALSAHVENVRTIGTGSAWATYFSAHHGIGVSGSGRYTYANETEVVDSSGVSIPVVSSYGVGLGAMGFWIHCGGHGQYGDDPTRPSASAITIGRGGALGLGWVSGLTFINSGIYGTDGSAASTTYGNAINLARMHKIVWAEPGTNTEGASIYSKVTVATQKVAQEFANNTILWRGPNNTPILTLTHIANAVNGIGIQSLSTGSSPMISAVGADTNIDLRLSGKGAGLLRYGTLFAIGAETVTKYFFMKDDFGNNMKVAVVS